MPLDFFDGFEHFAVTLSAKKWTGVIPAAGATDTITTGREAPYCFSSNAVSSLGATTEIYRTFATAAASGVVGAALYFGARFPTNPSGSELTDGRVISFYAGSDVQMLMSIATDGTVSVWRCDGIYAWTWTRVIGPVSAELTINSWHYFELDFSVSATVGYVDLYIDGVLIDTFDGDTRYNADTWTSVRIGHAVGLQPLKIDDAYAATGTSRGTEVKGDVRVDAHFPIADGATHTFTPSTGVVHYVLVDEQTPDEDDYNGGVASGIKDTFQVEPFKNPGGTILAVQLDMYVQKTDVGVATITGVVRHLTTDYDGDTLSPAVGQFGYQRRICETNPGTSAAWSEAHFNAAEFGYKKVA